MRTPKIFYRVLQIISWILQSFTNYLPNFRNNFCLKDEVFFPIWGTHSKPKVGYFFWNFQKTAFLLLYYSACKKATVLGFLLKKKLNSEVFKNTQNCFAYNSATKCHSEAVLYSKLTTGYLLNTNTIAAAFLQAE